MLDGRYIEPQHEELFSSAPILNSSVQVSFGVNMDFSDGPDCVAEAFKLKTPVIIGNQKTDWFTIHNYSFDHTMAPGGVPTGAKTSRDIIQLICKADDKKFKTT